MEQDNRKELESLIEKLDDEKLFLEELKSKNEDFFNYLKYRIIRETLQKSFCKIKIVNKSINDLPAYATPESSGLDLRVNLPSGDGLVIRKNSQRLVGTGLYIQLPHGYEAQVRPRSGLAAKHGITVLNTPGTIDADYRGEIMVLLANTSSEDYIIYHGERIAQLVIMKFTQVDDFEIVDSLDDSERGTQGIGHTGIK